MTNAEKKVSYYAVTQMCHGAEHKWIFDEETISREAYDNGQVPDEGEVAYWPIGGSNSSCAVIRKMNSDEEIYNFLVTPGDGPDVEDPMLVDIAVYYCGPYNGYCSCTDIFMQKYGLNYDDIFIDGRYNVAKKMIKALQESGYTDFDYADPFYGKNRDMRYDELCDLYERETGEGA